MQSLKFRPFVDLEKLRLRKSNFLILEKNRWVSTYQQLNAICMQSLNANRIDKRATHPATLPANQFTQFDVSESAVLLGKITIKCQICTNNSSHFSCYCSLLFGFIK